MKKLIAAAAVTVAAAGAGTVALVRWDPPAPSILLITLDTTRAGPPGVLRLPQADLAAPG